MYKNNDIVFGEMWFDEYQGILLWLLNASLLKLWFRWCLRIRQFDCSLNAEILKIMPNFFTWMGTDGVIKTDFRTHDKYSKRLYFAFKPLWYILHVFDWAMLDRVEALTKLSFGFSTLTQYPGSIGANNPMDAWIGRQNVDESWATIRSSTGNISSISATNASHIFIQAKTSNPGNFGGLIRSIYLFDTSSIGANGSVSAVTLSIFGTAKTDALSCTPNIDIYSSNPAADNAIANADFLTFGSISLTGGNPISYSSWSTSTYNVFTLDSNGIAAINKVGISKYGSRNQNYDVSGSTPPWVDFSFSNLSGNFSDKTGTVNDPKLVVTYTLVLSTVTTQAASSVTATTATGNGNITATGGVNATERGIVYSTTTHGDPGNVAPGSSDYSGLVNETGGSFGTGAFTESLTGLVSRTTYYARAYAYTTAGYAYGSEVNFTTIGFTNPANIYASDNTYATLAATTGILSVEVSKDAGANYSVAKTVTFTGSDTLQTVGNGSTELWGLSWTRADMVNANFYIRLSQGNISQVYKTFGFATGSQILTGVEVAIEGNWNTPTLSLDILKVKIYYGTSVLPVQAGSQAYASDGRKNGEGAGAGTGVLVFYDGAGNWIAVDSGATVAA